MMNDELKLASAAAQPIVQYYNSKAKNYDGRIDVTNHFPTFEPDLVVPSQSVQCTPESVGKVEPQSGQPYQVKDRVNRATECVLDVMNTISCINYADIHTQLVKHFRQLHICPEIEQVQA